MKKPSWITLAVWFFVGSVTTVCLFGFFSKQGVKPDTLSALFTALAFVGFLITSIYQTQCNACTEAEIAVEKRRNLRLHHDSLWLTVQIARLHSFSDSDDQASREKTRKEIEEHWQKLSTELAQQIGANR